jgi:hypothetical protein
MLKTRVTHGYCSRQLAAEAWPYANICEQCDNFVTAPEFAPALQAQITYATTLRDDAAERGWHTEVARHSRVITSIPNTSTGSPGTLEQAAMLDPPGPVNRVNPGSSPAARIAEVPRSGRCTPFAVPVREGEKVAEGAPGC